MSSQAFGEIKKDLVLYEVPLDDQLSLSEGENLNTHHFTEDGAISLSGRDDELLVIQENQPANEVRPYSPIHEHEVSPLIQDSRSDSLPIMDSIPLRHRGRSTSMGQTSTGPLLQRSERERILR